MPYTESLVSEHLRRIPVNDYSFGRETNRKIQIEHIIFTVLTHIHSAIQLALESEEDFDTIYGDRTIGDNDAWLILQSTLQRLASDNQIDLQQFNTMIQTISDYFTND